jgi:alpha-L-fucosidase
LVLNKELSVKLSLRRNLLVGLLLSASVALCARAAEPAAAPPDAPETKEQRDARMGWWREAKFGMFIHWGVYSVPAGTYDGKKINGIGEWIMNRGKIPVARYAEYPKDFTADKFNADEWAAIAKDAGVRYMVITSKHHDGFCMFHTKVDGYNIYDATPFKRDPLAELSVACKKQDIKLGFYYSQNQDWHHPGGGASGGPWDKAQDGDYDKYIDEVAVPQVREILTNYGDAPYVLWFDTAGKIGRANADKLYKVVKELRPNIIMNNRLGGGYKGDTETPEQHIPAGGFKDRDWETCMTINDTWGYKSYDDHWKSTETLLFNLVDIVSKGGNYLLNVGPTSEGVIPAPEVERLRAVGAWLKVNGEAIYGSHPSCFGQEFGTATKTKDGYGKEQPTSSGKDWRCTTKPGKIYVHIFKWPGEKIVLPPVKGKIGKAYMLADRDKALTVTQDEKGATVGLPEKAPDAICSVLCLEVEGG